MKIYEYLENYFRKKKLESKELEKIPKNYYLDLNELDYKKYMDTEPRGRGYISLWFFKGICSMFFWIFILYAISDFMDYLVITELLIKLFSPLLQASVIFIFAGFMFDMMIGIFNITQINKHKLIFYKRLKKYKKK